MKNLLQILLIGSLSTLSTYAVEFSSTVERHNAHEQTVNIHFNLAENEAILANSLHASADHPGVKVEKPEIFNASVKKYLPEFHQKKHIYNQNFTVSITVQRIDIDMTIDTMIHLSYLSTLNNSILDVQIPVHFEIEQNVPDTDEQNRNTMTTPTQLEVEQKNESWVHTLQNLVEHTKSPWAQILFALLLGLLLSLTPCIYPMIPITIGILHSQGKKSLLHDFLGSLSYACGLATTFACLGLLATMAGSSFGSLLSHPPFVICLVLFIGYMSLTMIGLVDLYIPSFMKGEVKLYHHFGPFIASYLFGAISGTVASPCVSPGLALLLSIVATLGNNVLGFLLLFAFGIGLSIPLIIIGTFSNSLYLLPQSGMWMVEIKKGLGFFMMATCFYYLANILPLAIVYWLFTAFMLFIAIFYLLGTQEHTDNNYKNLYTFIGIVMIGLTIVMATKSYEKTFYHEQEISHESVDWQSNYTLALDQAKEKNKLLLIDFWAQHCTICKAIEKKVFNNKIFTEKLGHELMFLKVDATHADNPEYVKLKEQYKVYAQPAILLIDPTTETVLKKWSSEPYSMPINEFIQQIKDIKK